MEEDIFSNLSIFQSLTGSQLSLLRVLFLPCDFYADSKLFAQGDPAEYLYVVVNGEVVVNFKPDDGPSIIVSRVHSGGIVGWSAALGSRHYTSEAVCVTYTQLLRVRGVDLRELCQRHPETGIVILDRLATVIAERLHSSHALVVSLLEMGLRSNVNETGG
jgi:CRP-like cAMP-binding protein